MQTKRGVVFSYRIKKKSIIPQYLMEYHENNKIKDWELFPMIKIQKNS